MPHQNNFPRAVGSPFDITEELATRLKPVVAAPASDALASQR